MDADKHFSYLVLITLPFLFLHVFHAPLACLHVFCNVSHCGSVVWGDCVCKY